MRFSPSYFVVDVKTAVVPFKLGATREQILAEREERKAVLGASKTIAACGKRYKTRKQAEAALAKVNAPAPVLRWLEVFEQSDCYF
jgi:regulator of protease activity HflC (stomatin/prohibitin superfamily)